MSAALTDAGAAPLVRRLDQAGFAATLLTPVFLLHGRLGAEVTMAITGLLFLWRSTLLADWAWLQRAWVRAFLAWWGWLVLCSVPLGGLGQGGWRDAAQALALVRFGLFVAALQHVVLAAAARRRWLGRAVTAAALYVGLQSLLQFATGRNLWGQPRSLDGTLTGPFDKSRAGAPFSRLLFPGLLAPVAGWPLWAAGIVTCGAVAIVVLIGQRMPLLLTGLGLIITGLLLRRLRPVVLVACVAVPALIATSVVISPPTFYRLVTKFTAQMRDFPDSPYGQLATRASVIALQHPVFGRGFDGFRNGCVLPRYFHDFAGGDGGGVSVCNEHPHNHYLQAADEAGLPGLVLFCILVVCWLRGTGRGLWRRPDPTRVGLFVAVLLQEWPIASASDFVSMPLSGWFFLLLGYGLAEADAHLT